MSPRHHLRNTTSSRYSTTQETPGKIYTAKRSKAYKKLFAAIIDLANKHPERYCRILSIYSPAGELNGRSSQHAQLATAAAFVHFQTVLLLNMDHATFETTLDKLRQQILGGGNPFIPIPKEVCEATPAIATSQAPSSEPHMRPSVNTHSMNHFGPSLPVSTGTNATIPEVDLNHAPASHQGDWSGVASGNFSPHSAPAAPFSGDYLPHVYTGMNEAQPANFFHMPMPELESTPFISAVNGHYPATGSSGTSKDSSSSAHASHY